MFFILGCIFRLYCSF